MLGGSGDRGGPHAPLPHSDHTAGGNVFPTCPKAHPPPRRSTAAGGIAQTPLQNASQKPPIASWSAASLPPRTGSEQSGQLTRYKRRTNDALRTVEPRRPSARRPHAVIFDQAPPEPCP